MAKVSLQNPKVIACLRLYETGKTADEVSKELGLNITTTLRYLRAGGQKNLRRLPTQRSRPSKYAWHDEWERKRRAS